MTDRTPRSGVLVVRLVADEPGGAPWLARASLYTDPLTAAVETGPLTTVEEVLQLVRAWIRSTVRPG